MSAKKIPLYQVRVYYGGYGSVVVAVCSSLKKALKEYKKADAETPDRLVTLYKLGEQQYGASDKLLRTND